MSNPTIIVDTAEKPCPNDCTRFQGKIPGHVYGSNWPWVPCQTCNGTMFVLREWVVTANPVMVPCCYVCERDDCDDPNICDDGRDLVPAPVGTIRDVELWGVPRYDQLAYDNGAGAMSTAASTLAKPVSLGVWATEVHTIDKYDYDCEPFCICEHDIWHAVQSLDTSDGLVRIAVGLERKP